jgi:hypothetical protein
MPSEIRPESMKENDLQNTGFQKFCSEKSIHYFYNVQQSGLLSLNRSATERGKVKILSSDP